jgi:translation elongation factor EF-1alpha
MLPVRQSALTGEGLLEPSANMAWSEHGSLLQTLDEMELPPGMIGAARGVDKHLRMVVDDVHKIPGECTDLIYVLWSDMI